MTVTLAHYLTLGAILFALSVVGIFLNRKNLIVLLMAIELMLLAVNINFVAFSAHLGDLVGQVFANASPAGQIILAACLPGLHCVAEGANAVEPPEDLTRQLRFSSEPSGWWLITQARSAGMQGDLPLHERTLRTRYGLLDVNENHMLLLEGRPVLGNPQPPGASTATAPAPAAAPSLMARLSTWWQGQWHRVMALLGTSPAPPRWCRATTRCTWWPTTSWRGRMWRCCRTPVAHTAPRCSASPCCRPRVSRSRLHSAPATTSPTPPWRKTPRADPSPSSPCPAFWSPTSRSRPGSKPATSSSVLYCGKGRWWR